MNSKSIKSIRIILAIYPRAGYNPIASTSAGPRSNSKGNVIWRIDTHRLIFRRLEAIVRRFHPQTPAPIIPELVITAAVPSSRETLEGWHGREFFVGVVRQGLLLGLGVFDPVKGHRLMNIGVFPMPVQTERDGEPIDGPRLTSLGLRTVSHRAGMGCRGPCSVVDPRGDVSVTPFIIGPGGNHDAVPNPRRKSERPSGGGIRQVFHPRTSLDITATTVVLTEEQV
mmetsp:Transcript_38506/g.81001  ORF Transcript_38506/g.81001 Transcript_38506/m.81001 type:complete len:226 (-) Transcript_38506:645-1322(-)